MNDLGLRPCWQFTWERYVFIGVTSTLLALPLLQMFRMLERDERTARAAQGDRPLGYDPDSGLPIYIKVGRFGPYVTEALPDGAKKGTKPRTASLLKAMQFESVGLDDAVRLLSLPRTMKATDGEEIVVSNGKAINRFYRGLPARKTRDRKSVG